MNRTAKSTGPAIIHAADFASVYGGNFITSLTALADACKRRDLRLVMVFPPAAGEMRWCRDLAASGQPIHFLANDAGTWRCARGLAKIAALENGVLLHTHFTQYDVAAWLAGRLRRLHGQKLQIVWHGHSDFPIQMTVRRQIKDAIKHRLMGRRASIVLVSEHLRQGIVARGFPAKNIQTVPNGVDLARATSATQSRAQVFSELRIAEELQLILLFGWEPRIKGVDLALDAVEALAREGLPTILGLVGDVDLENFVASRLKSPLPSWLKILPQTTNVANLYQAASVFVSASRSEGLPYSVCEALANGTPVVLSDIPSVSFAHATPGAVYFSSGDSDSLTRALRKVLQWSPEERLRNGKANEELARRNFDVRAWSDKICALYEELL
jgi:glycosyltransferase involved in cell wall biosynthesis